MSNELAIKNHLILSPDSYGGTAPVGDMVVGSPLDYSVDAKPLIDGDDVSWIATGLKVGNDQGRRNCCALQAIGNWINAVHKIEIPDEEVYRVHWSNGKGNVGMTFQRAFILAKQEGWFREHEYRGVLPTGTLASLKHQPLLAGYAIRGVTWNNVSEHGAISSIVGPVTSNHAVVIMAHGSVENEEPRVHVENSWGYKWACKGIANLSKLVHDTELREMWVIVK